MSKKHGDDVVGLMLGFDRSRCVNAICDRSVVGRWVPNQSDDQGDGISIQPVVCVGDDKGFGALGTCLSGHFLDSVAGSTAAVEGAYTFLSTDQFGTNNMSYWPAKLQDRLADSGCFSAASAAPTHVQSVLGHAASATQPVYF